MLQQQQTLANIPNSLQRLAEVNQLSTLLAVYSKRKDPGAQALGTFIIGLFVVIILGISAIGLAFVIAWQLYLGIIFALFVLVILLTVRSYYRAAPFREDQVVVYQEGLISKQGTDERAVRWEQVPTLFRGNTTSGEDNIEHIGDIDTMRVQGPDGKEYVLDASLPSHIRARVCDTIESEFLSFRLPEAFEQYNANIPLRFGTLQVSRSGISDLNETLPWSSITQCEVNVERVIIRKEARTSDWYNALIPNVPNACLLREVLAVVYRRTNTTR